MARILLIVLMVFQALLLPARADAYYFNASDPMSGPNGTWVGNMTPPIAGVAQSSGYFRYDWPNDFHGAYDYADGNIYEGYPIQAAASGVVVVADEWWHAAGRVVAIKHKESNHSFVSQDSNPSKWRGDFDTYIYTTYFHLSRVDVRVGDVVQQGQVIGGAGNTGGEDIGKVYPVHCHFGVQWDFASSWCAFDPGFFLGTATADASAVPTSGKISKFIWDATFNFTEPINDMVDTITEACTSGFAALRGLVKDLLIILITIDLAVAACFNMVNDKANPFFQWLVYKMFVYIIFIFMVEHWGDFIMNLCRDFFMGAGSMMAGESMEDTMATVRDPFALIQKGANLISPIFSELERYEGITDFLKAMVSAVPMFIFMAVIFGCLVLITYHIVIAYLEFYFIALFSFTTFVFAGFKETRLYAERGLSGIFACSVQLMFFCIFSMMLQNYMQSIVVEDFFSDDAKAAAAAADGNFGGIEGLSRVQAAIRQQESSGHYDIYEGQIAGEKPNSGVNQGYGAYQFTGRDRWKSGCDEYVASGSPYGPLSPRGTGDFPNDPNHYPGIWATSDYSWSPSNQDKVAKWQMYCLYQKYGNWKSVIEAWNGGEGAIGKSYVQDYYKSVCQKAGAGSPDPLINFVVLLKLTLACLMFLFLGDRLSQRIIKSLGSGHGFRFISGDD